MLAGIFYESGKVGVEELPIPKAASTDVVVQVLRAGICGADLYAYADNNRLTCVKQKGDGDANGEFGHELVGRVCEVGADTKDIKVGDMVWVNPTTAHRTGMAEGYQGGFSQYMLVEDAAWGYNLWKWDQDVDIDHAALMEPLCVGTHGVNQAKITAGDHVVILGAGPIGLCALSAALQKGCKNPVVIDLSDKRLEAVKVMGGVPFNSMTDGKMGDFLMNHFGTKFTFFGMPVPDVDAYVDCAGAATLLDQALHLVKDKSRVAIVAGYAKPYELDVSFLGAMQVSITGSRAYETPDIEAARDNINNNETNLDPIITHHFKIAELTEAFKTAADRTSNAIKVIIDMQ